MEHDCGVLGVCDKDYLKEDHFIDCLNKLQHRGYESAGVCYVNNYSTIEIYKNEGLVNNVFDKFKFKCNTKMAIGHVRYSTRKKNNNQNQESCQPFLSSFKNVNFALAHNGNIPNIEKMVSEYQLDASVDSDSLILVQLIKKLENKYDTIDEALIFIMNRIPGSYSLVVLTPNALYAIRDRYGVRPLCIGNRNENGYIVSSETVSLGKYQFVRDVQPGEIVKIKNSFEILDENGYAVSSETVSFREHKFIRDIQPGEIIKIKQILEISTVYQHTSIEPSFCSLEYIYFMHYKSEHNGQIIADVRYSLGFELGKNEQINNANCKNVSVPIPNSSLPSGKGFADGAKIDYCELIVKNPNMNRTFILPTQEEREIACEKKFSFLKDDIKGKNIYLIDDSVVRGTTTSYVINKLKEYGANTVHLRIISPPIISPCYLGIDMSTTKELIAHNRTVDEISQLLGADSTRYLDIDIMKNMFKNTKVCTSCFTGKYDNKLLDW